jgi:hypothetical protein
MPLCASTGINELPGKPGMRNRIHVLNTSKKQILSLGGLQFGHTVSAISSRIFFFIRDVKYCSILAYRISLL